MAAKGGAGSGPVVGTATVNVVFQPDKESLEQVAAAAQEAASGGGDATNSQTTPRKGKNTTPGVASAATATEANVKAKVNKTVAKDIQDQLNAHQFEINIDATHLRKQIEAALKQTFVINVEAQLTSGESTAQAAHHAVPLTAQAQRQSVSANDLPDRLKGQFGKFGTAIQNLHQRLVEANEAVGKTFGKLGANGSNVDKAIDILQEFGASDFSGLLQIKDTGKLPKVTGGSLSQEALVARGYDPNHAASIEQAGREFTSVDDKGKFRQSDALAFWKNLGQFLEQNPQIVSQAAPEPAQPHAAPRTASAAVTPTAAADNPALEAIKAADKTLKAIARQIPTQPVAPQDFIAKYPANRSTSRTRGVSATLDEERSGTGVVEGTGEVTFPEVIPGKTGRRVRRNRAATPDLDPEATARSVGQLGTRRNPRALLGGFNPREIDGQRVDIQPLLRAAQLGEFQGLIRQQKTGELHRFVPRDEDEAARARAIGTNPRGFTLEGLGRVQNVHPTEAFWTAVSQAFDEDIAAKLKLDPEVNNLVRGSIRAGSDLQAPGDPRPAMPGQGGGESGGVVNSTARGFERSYRAAFRLRDTLGEIKSVSDEIEERWDRIAQLQGSGKSTDKQEAQVRKREDRLAQLEARAKDLARVADLSATPELQAMAGASRTPQQTAILNAARDARNAAEKERSGGRYVNTSQRIVGEGVGLTEEDLAKRARTDPNLIGRAQQRLGLGDMQGQILKQVLTKFQDPNFIGQRRNEKGEVTETFPESSISAMSRAFREVVGEIKLPEDKTEKRLTETAISDVRQALFGQRTDVIEGQGDTAYQTSERRGGFFDTVMRRQAEQAADRADSGRGEGRRAKMLGSAATGAAAASGIPERMAQPMRPATALDTERQTLMAAYDAEARKVAQKRTEGRDYKQLGFESQEEFVRSELMSPPIRRRDGSTVPAGIKSGVRAEVESTTDVGKRVAEIRSIQAAADKMLAGIASKTEDVNEQRQMVTDTGRVGSRGSAAFSEAVKAEALNVLQTRTAGAARSAYTRDTKDPVTGDETRSAYARGGGIAAGRPLTPDGKPAPGSWAAKDIASPSGTMHVIIAGQTAPIQVTMAAAGGGGSGGGGRRPPRGRVGGTPEDPMGPQFGPPVPPGLFPDGPAGAASERTAYGTTQGASRAFDKAYDARDPLNIYGTSRKRPVLRVKRTAEEIGRQRMAREAEQEQRRAAIEAERPFKEASSDARRNEAAAALNARAAEQPFKDASENARRDEAAQARTARAARQQAAAQARMVRESRRLSRTNDPEGLGRQRDVSDDEFEGIRAKNRSVQRSVPRRGFGASLTDLVTARLGGNAFERQLEAADRAQRESNEITQYGQQRATLRTQRSGFRSQAADFKVAGLAARAAGDTEGESRANLGRRSAIQAARGLDQQLVGLGKAIDISKDKFMQNATEATRASTVLKSFGAAAAGSTISTGIGAFTVGLGMAVAAPIITGVTEGITQVLGPMFERATGFGSTTGRIQGEQAATFRGTNDDLRATLAQTGIAARLSQAQLNQISPALGERATTVAGTQALASQFDQFNVARNARDQQTQGYDRALTRSTGGVFDVHIPTYLPVGDFSVGGQASTAETLAGQLRTLAGPTDFKQTNPEIGDNLGIGDNFQTRQANDAKANQDLLNKNNQQLAFLNENLKDSKFQLVAGGTEQELKDQQARLASVGAESLGQTLKDKQITIQGLGANTDPREFLKAYNQGPQLSPEDLLAQDSRSIKAQVQLEDAQRQLALQTTNPQTTAIAEAQHPLGPAAAGIGFSKRDNPTLVKGLNADLAETQKRYDDINKEIDTGIQASKEFVSGALGAGPGAEFAASLDKVVALGKQITSIEVGVQTKQAAYSAKQFAFQIDLAKRSLSDAKGLVSGIGDSMGAIERQIFNLQRQSQALSLGQSQRQINFQKAVAGFQAPGLSSEEAEARQNQAKTEAEYAQKQLDIQKKLFGLQGRQFDKGAARQVRDLTRQLGLLEQGREVSLSTAAAEKKILALTKIQAKENKNVETFYNSAVTRTGDIMSEEAKLVAATGKDMRAVGNIVLQEFKRTYEGYWQIVNGPNQADNQQTPSVGNFRNALGGMYMDDYTHAEGWMGTVNGKTSFGKYGVAGEAGGEAVAFIRDPKNLTAMPGSGGGGNTFVVNIYNPIVKNNEDQTRLVADVKRAIQKEAALLLPRRA